MKLLRQPAVERVRNITFEWRPALVTALALYAVVQWTVPFRHILYDGEVLWNEEGMRWSWKVMAREKNGEANFRVQDRTTGRTWYVSPSDYLLRHQENEMSVTPDMILQFAHFLQKKFGEQGHDVAVFVDTMTSYNGRLAKPLIDASVDLTQEQESFWPKEWVLQQPTDEPHRLRVQRLAR